MKMTSTTAPSLVLAALLVGGALSAAAKDVPAATADAVTWAPASTPDQQLAAAGNRLRGPQIRQLLSGHTARMQRQRAQKRLMISLSFRPDGTVRHRCESEHVNVRAQGQVGSRCRTPRARGNWEVRGNKLCVTVGRRRCYFVIRRGGGYVFRSPVGKGRPYAGKVSVQ
jgi:hypothetical protein